MGRLKNDIDTLVDDSTFRGKDRAHIAQRLIEAGLAIFEAQGTLHEETRIACKMEGDGSYYVSRMKGIRASSAIELFNRVLGSDAKPGWSYVVKIGGDGVLHGVHGTADDPREALQHAADQFLAYRDSHAAKHTEEGDAKARTNEHMAAMCFRALGEDKVGQRVATSPDYMLALVPVADDEKSFRYTVATLVENGYERGIAHDDMMRSLFQEAFDIGTSHGWQDHGRVILRKRRDGDFDVGFVAPTTPIGQEIVVSPEIRPVGADSGDFRSIVVPDSIGALLRCSDEPVSRRELVAYVTGKAEVASRKGDSDLAAVLQALAHEIAQHMEELPIPMERALREFFRDTHERNRKAGWWTDLATGKPKRRSVGELLMLFVTEIAEAYEAYTARAADDKLPQYPGFGVELGDLLIRLGDLAGAAAAGHLVEYTTAENPGDQMFREVVQIAERYEAIRKTPAAKGPDETGEPIPPMDIAVMVTDKLAFNATRADHKPEARMAEGGKVT